MNSGKEVIDWIHSLLPFGIKPGLKRMEWMLERIGHPEKKINTIHVGGTNGKGSTVSFMRHVLIEAGYNVGTFTSPYIECFEERISLNGQPIDEDSFIQSANKIRPLVDELTETELGSPTEFEVITTIAFDYFAHFVKPDIVLVEVGLGGRFDSTNVITPLLSIITSIGFDHMHILGDTITDITYEKAGIIKRNTPIISGVSQVEALDVIKKIARSQNANYEQLGVEFNEQINDITEKEQRFLYSSKDRKINLVTQMKGPHQRENAAVAIRALERLQQDFNFNISEQSFVKGIALTTWMGRFEQISADPIIILDGAHNQEGMESLAKTLVQHYPNNRYRFIVAATVEKDMRILLKPFEQMDASFTFTSFDFFRAADADQLCKNANVKKKRYDPNWERAINSERVVIDEDEILIISGSLYFISKVRQRWYES